MNFSLNLLIVFWTIYSLMKSSSAMICSAGFELRLTPEQMERKRECLRDQGVDVYEELDKERHACYVRCVMKREGFLNEANVPIKGPILLEVGQSVPFEYRPELLARLEFCVDEHYLQSKSREEDTYQFYSSCDSYVPLGECLNNALVRICQGGSVNQPFDRYSISDPFSGGFPQGPMSRCRPRPGSDFIGPQGPLSAPFIQQGGLDQQPLGQIPLQNDFQQGSNLHSKKYKGFKNN